jgi:hypothetical protein
MFIEESVGKTIEFWDLGICTMYLPIRQRETWVNLALSLCACISVMIACDLLVIKVSAQGCWNVKNLGGGRQAYAVCLYNERNTKISLYNIWRHFLCTLDK